jgi:general secretion pathway protein F
MTQFRARTFDAETGAVSEALVDGHSAAEVKDQLQRSGHKVLGVKPVRFASGALLRRDAGLDVVLLCEEIRTLLVSGMSLVETVDTLCAKEPPGRKADVLSELRTHLLEGKPLSAALAANRWPFSPLLVASVRASERSSRLEEALSEFIGYEKVGRELRRKIVSAAIYPAMVVGFGALVCFFMVGYVVPRFARVYEDFGQAVSLSTQVLIALGRFMDQYFGLALAALILFALGGWWLQRRGYIRSALLALVSRVGFVRHYLRIYQLSRLYQTISMLLKGGFTLIDAMPLARNLALEPGLQSQLDTARRLIAEGQRPSKAFEAGRLTDTVTVRLLQVGERSGNLADIMATIAHGHRQEFTLFIERTTRVAEPLLLMIVGVMLGAIILVMYMPVFDLAGGI